MADNRPSWSSSAPAPAATRRLSWPPTWPGRDPHRSRGKPRRRVPVPRLHPVQGPAARGQGGFSEAEEAEAWGVTFGKPKIDVDKLRAWKDEVVGKLTGGLGQMVEQRKIDSRARHGRASRTPHTLSDRDARRQDQTPGLRAGHPRHRLAARSAAGVSADDRTGSWTPPAPWSWQTSQVAAGGRRRLHRPGTGLGLCRPGQQGDRGGDDHRSAARRATAIWCGSAQAAWKTQFEAILLNTKVAGMKEQKNGVKVTLEGQEGRQTEHDFDKVLVAVGRRPNTEDLGLENTGVELDEAGFRERGRPAPHRPTEHLRHRRRGRRAHAGPQGHPRGRVAAEAIAGAKRGLRTARHPGRGLHRSGDRLVRPDRNRGQSAGTRSRSQPVSPGRPPAARSPWAAATA